jgi:hypothetical protein
MPPLPWYIRYVMWCGKSLALLLGCFSLWLLTACRSVPSMYPAPSGLPEPDASTILVYSSGNDQKMQFQVQSFHPQYCEFQVAFSEYPGTSWTIEVMDDALEQAQALLTQVTPVNMRLNQHTAIVLSRRLASSLRDSGQAFLEWSHAVKAFEANGDSLVLFQPGYAGKFQVFNDQSYRLSLNGKPVNIPTKLCQGGRNVLRYAECGANLLALGWYEGYENWELESVWHYRDVPVCGELRKGNWLMYAYHHPVQTANKQWTYETDTFILSIQRSDTLLQSELSAFNVKMKTKGRGLGKIVYNRNQAVCIRNWRISIPWLIMGSCRSVSWTPCSAMVL